MWEIRYFQLKLTRQLSITKLLKRDIWPKLSTQVIMLCKLVSQLPSLPENYKICKNSKISNSAIYKQLPLLHKLRLKLQRFNPLNQPKLHLIHRHRLHLQKESLPVHWLNRSLNKKESTFLKFKEQDLRVE